MKKIFQFLLISILGMTLSCCVSRIPLTEPDTLISLKGRKLRVKREFFAIPLNDTQGTMAKYRGILANVESIEHFAVSPGDVLTIVDFHRLPKDRGSFVLMNVSILKNGENRIVEIEIHPNYNIPGKTLAEKTAFQLRDKNDISMVLE
jgi:hypothetical protein